MLNYSASFTACKLRNIMIGAHGSITSFFSNVKVIGEYILFFQTSEAGGPFVVWQLFTGVESGKENANWSHKFAGYAELCYCNHLIPC